MASSTLKTGSLGTRLPLFKRKPRMRVILPTHFQPFKLTVTDQADHDLVDDSCFEDADADEQIVADHTGDDISGKDGTISAKETSGKVEPVHLKRKPRMRVIPPSRFQRFRLTLTEAEHDLLKVADLDDDDDMLDSDSDGDTSAKDDDIGIDTKASSSKEATGTHVSPLQLKPRMRVLPLTPFWRFKVTLSEADQDLEDYLADSDDDDDDTSGTDMNFDDDFQVHDHVSADYHDLDNNSNNHVEVADLDLHDDEEYISNTTDFDHDGFQEGYVSDSSLESTATSRPRKFIL